MGLQFRPATVGFIRSSDLEFYAHHFYAADFSFGEAAEVPDGASRHYETGPWDQIDDAQWSEETASGYLSCTSLLLDRMVRDGHLPHGTYVMVLDS